MLFLVLLVAGCAKTSEEVLANGDVVIRTADTPLGWLAMIPAMVIGLPLVAFGFVFVIAVLPREAWDGFQDKDYGQLAFALFAIPFALAVLGLMAWAISSYTVLRTHTVEVVAAKSESTLTVRQTRLIGGTSTETWRFDEVEDVEYLYLASDDSGAMGSVSVQTTTGDEVLLFEGSPCPARDLAEAVASAIEVPIEVRPGIPASSSVGAFFSSLRCGTTETFDPLDPGSSVDDLSRALDFSFFSWRWAVPLITLQTVVLAIAVGGAGHSDSSLLRAIVFGATVAVLIALHVAVVIGYGRWPPVLVLLTLLSVQFAARRAGLTPRIADMFDS
ncbi:MAG: hypothetical protein QNJ81_14190 [Acidimicrobiia bacterium]|nr:hypothetical protein [Acidimicrobiia bacterium]